MIWFLFELNDHDICALGANSTGIDLGATQREERAILDGACWES